MQLHESCKKALEINGHCCLIFNPDYANNSYSESTLIEKYC